MVDLKSLLKKMNKNETNIKTHDETNYYVNKILFQTDILEKFLTKYFTGKESIKNRNENKMNNTELLDQISKNMDTIMKHMNLENPVYVERVECLEAD